MRRLKSFLLILIALWLPIQAAAAVAMPFCRHAAETAVTEAVHCHEQVMESNVASDLDCDNCEMCHLASAGFLLPLTIVSGMLSTASVLVPGQKPATPSHIGAPPRHPPRHTNA